MTAREVAARAIETDALCKHYGEVVAVDRLRFAVAPGRITGFLGRNGAGKSTTIKLLLGMIAPTAGTACVLGHRIDRAEDSLAIRRHVAYVGEDKGLYPDAELAIASAFKLYVLLGLADHVADGRAAWTDAVAMRDAWRSLPGGITQDEPTGARLTLRTLAERMISISDNTASDILIETVGRRRVEAALGATGHANPALDVPFLETRELFWLKMAAPAAEVTRYLSLAEAPRRAYLERLAGKRPTASFDDWTTPRHIDRIEWFASSTDLCRAMAALWTRGQTPAGAPVLEVLAKNPGLIPGTLAPWSYAGFKGGSEPGVVNATWLLQRKADQRWFVVTLGLNGPTAIDEGAIIGLASGVLAILANDAP